MGSEVTRLHESSIVEETAHFSVENGLTYRIWKGPGDIRAELMEGAITVHVPSTVIDRWAMSDDVGINARDGQMRITIEKDFRCMTRREEDEVDAYPHPVEQASC